MLTKFVVLFLFIVGIIGLLVLYFIKVGIQLQLINRENKKPAGRILDLTSFSFKDEKAKKLRIQALLRYPLMFPVDMDEADPEDIRRLKKQIKNANIVIYLILMMMILLVVYADKAYPQGLL